MLASEAASLETLTIRGCSLARSSGRNCWTMSHGPYRLVSAASRTTARSASTARCQVSYVMAALLTRTSSLPYRSATCRAAAAMLAGSVTSSWRGSASDGAGGGRGGVGRAGGQQDAVTPLGELAAHLEADAAIAAGNQRDGAHIVDCLHIM